MQDFQFFLCIFLYHLVLFLERPENLPIWKRRKRLRTNNHAEQESPGFCQRNLRRWSETRTSRKTKWYKNMQGTKRPPPLHIPYTFDHHRPSPIALGVVIPSTFWAGDGRWARGDGLSTSCIWFNWSDPLSIVIKSNLELRTKLIILYLWKITHQSRV